MKKLLAILLLITALPAVGQPYLEKYIFRGDTLQSWHRNYWIVKGDMVPWARYPFAYDLGKDTMHWDTLWVNYIQIAPVQITYDQIMTLRSAGKLSTGVTYEIIDATQQENHFWKRDGSSVFIMAIDQKTLATECYWKSPTKLTGIAWDNLSGMGASDTIKQVTLNGVNYLATPVPFTIDMNTTLDIVAAQLNADTTLPIKAFSNSPASTTQRPRLVLEWEYPEDSVNGYVMDITGTAGVVTEDAWNMTNGADVDTFYLRAAYDIDDDQIEAVYDDIRNFKLINAPEQTMYNFRYEDPLWNYVNAQLYLWYMDSFYCSELILTDMVMMTMDSEYEWGNGSWKSITLSQSRGANCGMNFSNSYGECSVLNLAGDELSEDGAIKCRNTIVDFTGQCLLNANALVRGAIDIDSSYFGRALNISSNSSSFGKFNASNRLASIKVLKLNYTSTATSNFTITGNYFDAEGSVEFSYMSISAGGMIMNNIEVSSSRMIYNNTAIVGTEQWDSCSFKNVRNNGIGGINFTNESLTGIVTRYMKIDGVEVRLQVELSQNLNNTSGRGLVNVPITVRGRILKYFYAQEYSWEGFNITSSGSPQIQVGYGSDDSAVFPRTDLSFLLGNGGRQDVRNPLKAMQTGSPLIIARTSGLTAGRFNMVLYGQLGTAYSTDSTINGMRATRSFSGNATFSGNGSQTSFVVTHNLGSVPSSITFSPSSSAAVGGYISAKTRTTFTITYPSAPASGTNNITLSWDAKR